ncbi:hypothetical protein G6F66_013512 [Rhizopus arrhizus]|nr:hypothetical protein G6F66_013512 [Rhizopus arrhizus]
MASTTTTLLPLPRPTTTVSTNNVSPLTNLDQHQIFSRPETTTTDRRGTPSSLLPRMGNSNQQLLASQYYSARLPHSIHSTSTSHLSTATYITSRLRPTPTNRAINSRFTSTKGHQGSEEFYTRFLQLNLCNSQEKQRNKTSLQPQGSKSIYTGTTIQNGNSFRSLTFDKEKRLSHLDRPSLGFYPYPNPSSIKEVSAIPLERQNMGVHNSPFRPQYRTLSLHQTDSSDPSMGTQPGQFSTLKW